MPTFHTLEGFKKHTPNPTGRPSLPKPLKQAIGTYCITVAETGMVYIGSTSNLTERFKSHLTTLRCNKHSNNRLQAAYNTDPGVEIMVKPSSTIAEAQALEQKLVDGFKDTGYLCNVAVVDVTRPGLCNLGKTISEEHRQKLSDLKLGIPRTDDVKLKRSASTKAFYQTEQGQRFLQSKSKTVMIDGTQYSSISEASRALKQSPFLIKKKSQIMF
jgi:predicted GIY-YIG superfamily endonuclease